MTDLPPLPVPDGTAYGPNRTVAGHYFFAAKMRAYGAACVAAYKADAERYRWLRSRVPGGTYRIMGVIYSEGGAGVDEAIDRARGEA